MNIINLTIFITSAAAIAWNTAKGMADYIFSDSNVYFGQT